MDHAGLRATLDLSRPVALLLIGVLHFIDDTDDPYGLVAALTGALADGSHLTIVHGTTDFLPPEMKAKVAAINAQERDRVRDSGTMRDKAAIARFFDKMELIPPGIVSIADWRNDAPPEERVPAGDTYAYGAVARIRPQV